jgi:Ca2+-binding EF-hand superfamily protein
MVLPCEDNILRKITLERYPFRVGRYENLPYTMERELNDLIFNEISLLRRVESLKAELTYRYDYSVYATFRTIDRFNDGFINIDNLKAFFRSNYIYVSDKETLAMIRRIDTDGDA